MKVKKWSPTPSPPSQCQTYSDVCIRTDASNELLHLGGEKIASVWESSETDPAKAWDFDDNNS